MSTAAALDGSGGLTAHLRCAPGNAHHYLLADMVTQILKCFGEAMFLQTLEELSHLSETGSEFAILADECTDINGRGMLSVCLRYLWKRAVIERFLCVVPLVSTTAKDVRAALLRQMTEHKLNPTKLAAASFDGASNFSSVKSGVHNPRRNSAHVRLTPPRYR